MSQREAQCPDCGAIFRSKRATPFVNADLAKRYCPACHPIRARQAGVRQVFVSHLKPALRREYEERYP